MTASSAATAAGETARRQRPGERKPQSAVRWTGRDAGHACRALDRANLHQLVDGQRRGAGARTPGAVDARVRVAADFERAQQRSQTHERAIRAEIAAPEVLNHERQRNQRADDHGCRGAHLQKEVEHLYVGNEAVGRVHECVERLCGHGADDEQKESEQEILEAAQWNIDPARQMQIAAENPAAELPQILRERADGAEPGAESFLGGQAHGEERHEKEHGRGMNFGNAPGGQQIFEVHQPGDGQPAFSSRRARNLQAMAAGCEESEPEIKLDAQPAVEQYERKLNQVAYALRAVRRGAVNQLSDARERSAGSYRLQSHRVSTLPVSP